ncbi:Membrane protein involved in the export of O-antigen and teichoic acid [Pedobacter westerhofensis]|uniref:Membrane protein involved in the export of O-antigen and teichoic acid n=1 Tax=Pedobacter westerhofensis TaxID=425512 RepID=A0A521C8T9_9SPHI|nr:O-unit flippase-like protein [Pedobacter westerhofensis]SMO55764.1 Membrane protein involved in the export of O-antigen and teichoic acid [Pedobacter westerhofensis]
MSININKNDILWSYIAQFLNYGSGLFLLPFILKLFTTQEIGLWYLFLNMSALAFIMDFGFLPNITRTVSYIYSGAQSLSKEGIPEKQSTSGINYTLLKSVIGVVRNIYGIITIILLVTIFIGGSFYLKSIIHSDTRLWISFYIFALSICLNFFYSYYDALLLGRGLIKAANQAISIAKLVYLLAAVLGILFHCGLLSISIASLISTLLNRILYYNRFYDRNTKAFLANKAMEDQKQIFSQIWHNAKKLGLVSLGSFLIFQVNLLIAGRYFTIAEVASLGLSMQLFSTLCNFSRLYFTTLIPKFNSLRVHDNIEELKREFIKSMKIGWVGYLSGTVIICLAGNSLLEIFHSKTNLPDSRVLVLFAIVYLLEITHGNCATFLTTKNTVPFVNAALWTGFFVILFNFILILGFNLRIECFAISIILVQLSYNVWKWPYEVIKDLNIKFIDFYGKLF